MADLQDLALLQRANLALPVDKARRKPWPIQIYTH